jgi:hypothetical protein
MRSELKVEYNFLSQVWNFHSIKQHKNNFIFVNMMFKNGEDDNVFYKDLKFGCHLYDDDSNKLIDQKSFPIDENTKYVATASDQDYVESIFFSTVENKNYRIHVWVENDGIRSESEHVFSTFFKNQSF